MIIETMETGELQTIGDVTSLATLLSSTERPVTVEGARMSAQFTPVDAVKVKRWVQAQGGKHPVHVAARAFGIGHTRIYHAEVVMKSAEINPALYGDLPAKMKTQPVEIVLREAKRRLKYGNEKAPLPAMTRSYFRADRDAAYAPETKRKLDLANGQKRKIGEALGLMSGLCAGLELIDIQMAFSVSDEKEQSVWVTQARQCAKVLQDIAGRLKRKPRPTSAT